jgi:AcrR family transcriptional regulator
LTAVIDLVPAPQTRKASRPVRRQQLIDATIGVLARKGFSALTVSDVAKAAGLSVGIINFHFESKEKLLSACLSYLANEYSQNWRRALATPRATDAQKLQSMMLGDIDDSVFTNDKLGAWIAFWGEAQGRPTYMEICSTFDDERTAAIINLCRKITLDGGYAHNPEIVAQALESLNDGLWLGVASGNAYLKSTISAENARQSIQAALTAFFPKHFPS